MATVTITADTNDGTIVKSSTTNWEGARDATSGTGYMGFTTSPLAVRVQKTVSGRTTTWTIARTVMQFDVSAIHDLPSEGSLQIYGLTNGTADMMAMKGVWIGAFGPNSSSYNSIEGWSSGVNNQSNVTKYSDEITTWTLGGINNIPLKPRALADIAGEDYLRVVFAEWDYDVADVEVPVSPPHVLTRSGWTMADSSSNKPTLKLTTEDVVQNSVFFGANF